MTPLKNIPRSTADRDMLFNFLINLIHNLQLYIIIFHVLLCGPMVVTQDMQIYSWITNWVMTHSLGNEQPYGNIHERPFYQAKGSGYRIHHHLYYFEFHRGKRVAIIGLGEPCNYVLKGPGYLPQQETKTPPPNQKRRPACSAHQALHKHESPTDRESRHYPYWNLKIHFCLIVFFPAQMPFVGLAEIPIMIFSPTFFALGCVGPSSPKLEIQFSCISP